MKKIISILIFSAFYISNLSANICYSITSNGTTEVTVAVSPDIGYSGTNALWISGNVTIAWPESLGSDILANVSVASSFPFATDGIPTLISGSYYQKYGFLTPGPPTNLPMTAGVNVNVLVFTIPAQSTSLDFEISENPPAGVANGTASLSNFASEQWILGGGCPLIATVGPLPVELTQFDVNKKGEENALITWQTATEVNTSHFDIERSLDNGRTWEKVGIKSAQGFSTAVNNYSFEDKNLKRFIDENQLVYYRLKSVDFDQSHQLSETKNIRIELIDISIAIYPNPTVEGVNVTIHSKDKREELMVEMKDISGRTIFSQALGNSKMINEYLSFGNLASGTYFMTVQSEERVFSTEKLIILEK